jgi:hypothetical protein
MRVEQLPEDTILLATGVVVVFGLIGMALFGAFTGMAQRWGAADPQEVAWRALCVVLALYAVFVCLWVRR